MRKGFTRKVARAEVGLWEVIVLAPVSERRIMGHDNITGWK